MTSRLCKYCGGTYTLDARRGEFHECCERMGEELEEQLGREMDMRAGREDEDES